MSAIPDEIVRRITQGLEDADPQERYGSAQHLVQFPDRLSPEQVRVAAAAVVGAAVREVDPEALFGELDALNHLLAWHRLDRSQVSRLHGVDRSVLGASDEPALDTLLAYADGIYDPGI